MLGQYNCGRVDCWCNIVVTKSSYHFWLISWPYSQQVGDEEEHLPEKREDPDGGEELATSTNPPSPTEPPETDVNGKFWLIFHSSILTFSLRRSRPSSRNIGKIVSYQVKLLRNRTLSSLFVTFHDWIKHIVPTIIFELRWPLLTTTFELLLLQIWSL